MKRGHHINSLKALEKYRYKALETKKRNKEIRLMRVEVENQKKKRGILDLELEIFTIKSKEEEKDKYIEELLTIEPLNVFQLELLKSFEYVTKLVLCGSNKYLPQPPPVKSSRGTLIATVSISPLSFTLVAVVLRDKSKSPAPLVGTTLNILPAL